jgi:hypothetical protein
MKRKLRVFAYTHQIFINHFSKMSSREARVIDVETGSVRLMLYTTGDPEIINSDSLVEDILKKLLTLFKTNPNKLGLIKTELLKLTEDVDPFEASEIEAAGVRLNGVTKIELEEKHEDIFGLFDYQNENKSVSVSVSVSNLLDELLSSESTPKLLVVPMLGSEHLPIGERQQDPMRDDLIFPLLVEDSAPTSERRSFTKGTKPLVEMESMRVIVEDPKPVTPEIESVKVVIEDPKPVTPETETVKVAIEDPKPVPDDESSGVEAEVPGNTSNNFPSLEDDLL